MPPIIRSLVFVALAIATVGTIYHLTYRSNSELLVNRALSSAEIAKIQDLLKAVQKDLGIESEISSSFPITPEWKNSKHESIRLNGYSFPVNLMEKDANSLPKLELVTDDFITEQSAAIDAAFDKAGAKLNDFNYDVSDIIKVQKAYVKDDIRCLAQFISSDPFATVFCGLEDPIVKQWLEKLSRAADPTDDPNAIINIDKVVGNNASVLINSKFGGGHFVLLHKKGLRWHKVFEGQDSPECALVDKYKMDKQVYENCYDTNTGTTRFSSN